MPCQLYITNTEYLQAVNHVSTESTYAMVLTCKSSNQPYPCLLNIKARLCLCGPSPCQLAYRSWPVLTYCSRMQRHHTHSTAMQLTCHSFPSPCQLFSLKEFSWCMPPESHSSSSLSEERQYPCTCMHTCSQDGAAALQHVVHASLHGIAYGRVKVKELADIATYAVRFILQEPNSPPCNLLSASAAVISQQVAVYA